jgi:hypothetical protein
MDIEGIIKRGRKSDEKALGCPIQGISPTDEPAKGLYIQNGQKIYAQ